MIQSLQKIEFAVERSSEDTRELIKAGWDKMLGNVGRVPDTSSVNLPVKEIASGLSAELRAELGLNESAQSQTPPVGNEQIERLNELLENLEASLEIQLDTLAHSERPSEALDYILNELSELSLEAQELARAIIPRHLTLPQYQVLLKSSQLSEAISELRMNGLLVPLEGFSEDGSEVPIYYFPSPLAETMRTALLLLPDVPSHIREVVEAELQEVDYFSRDQF